MDKPLKKVIHDGKVHYTVPDAARYLGTTATKVRELLGAGKMEWTQTRVNGKLIVTAESLTAYKYRQQSETQNK